MVALVCFPDAPPLCELADGAAWERRKGVEWRETITSDRECEDDKVGGEREEDG